MQGEINDLRGQLQSCADTELIRSQLMEQAKENKRKDQELRNLNDKFHEVHKGLLGVEEERQRLRLSMQRLENEKRKIQSQLDIREKEVLSLARRCSSQEEKMKEAAKMRASHGDLSNQVEDLRTSLSVKNKEILQIERLKQELEHSEASKQELQFRLSKLKKDHDDIAETLNSCFSSMQKMTDSHRDREEDRRREQQRAELDLEHQRLAHLEATADLRRELECRQTRIDQIENILKENMAISTALRKEHADATMIKEAALSAQKLEYEQQLASLQANHDSVLASSQEDNKALLKKVQEELNEKVTLIAALERELSICMQNMMAMSSDLEQLQSENEKTIISHRESLLIIEKEILSLREQATSNDVELTMMNFKLSNLESENSDLSKRLENVLARCAELEEENAFIMDLEEQLLEVNYEIVETEEEQIMAAEEHQLAMESLRAEYDNQRSMWYSMEKGLVERLTSLEKEKNEILDELKRFRVAANSSTADLEGRLKRSDDLAHSLNSTVEILRKALNEKDERVAAINATLEGERMKSMNHDDIMSALHLEIEDLRSNVEVQTVEMEKTLAEKAIEMKHLEEELSNERTLRLEDKNKCLNLQAELDLTKDVSKRALDNMITAVQDKDNETQSLFTELEYERKISKERDIRCQNLESDLFLLRQDNEKVVLESSVFATEKEQTIVAITAELRNLENEVTRKDEDYCTKILIKEQTIQHLEFSLNEQQNALEQLTFENQAILTDKKLLFEDLEREREKSVETESRIKCVEAALLKLRQDAKSSTLQLSTSIVEKDQKIQLLSSELTKLREDFRREGDALRAVIVTRDQSIMSLQEELDKKIASVEQLKLSKHVALSEKNTGITVMQNELDACRAKQAKDDEQKFLLLQEKENQIVSLKNEINISNETSLERNEASRKEILSLTSKLQRATTDLTIAEDEIRELKLVDLKEAEDTISSLENEVKMLRKKTTAVSRNAADTTADLECQVAQLRTKTSSLERSLIDTKHMHEKTVEKMQSEQASLKEDNLRLTAELQERFEKLQERHSTIASMTTNISQLEANERLLQSEIETMRVSEAKVKGDYEILAVALEHEMQKQQMNREDHYLERQKQQSVLLKELADAEMKINSHQEQMATLEAVIDERSRLLAEMVSHNKETEDALVKAQVKLSDLELVADNNRIEKENAKLEIDRLVVLLQRKDDQFLDTLQNERQRREIVEADLENAIASARLSKTDNKELEELERENAVLKDKVRRQEAYLKRKLEKDKALRDRTIPCDKLERDKGLRDRTFPSDSIFKERSVTAIKNVMATPLQSKIQSKIATPARSKIPSPSKRGPISISQIAAPSSGRSTTTIQTDSSSFPDEWDLNSLY